MSQAWSLVKFGKLAPYTYWYDHAPAGWIFIAGWSILTGGFFTFGSSVEGGRVFMLVLHVASTYFLYSITKKLSKSTLAAATAAILFSISPLGIYYQRRVLLDNIMTFWTLFSLWIIIKPTLKLRQVILSSLAFGIAVLSKENAIFFFPGLLYALWLYSKKEYRRFFLSYWIIISFSLISLYFLYAFLKSELLPTGVLGNTTPHVSLLTTLHDQLSRGNNNPFWSPQGEFYPNLMDWLRQDMVLITLGIATTIINALLAIKIKLFRIPALFSVFFWLFLLRGKLVIVFYITPLLPFLAMNIGLLFQRAIQLFSFHKKLAYQTLATMIIIALATSFYFSDKEYLIKDETTPQLQTIAWVKQNIPSNARIVIDDALYVDLHDRKTPDETVYPYADWAWKIEKDPDVYKSSLQDDWKNIQYITLSHEILKQIKDYEFPLTKKALDHSVQLVDFANTSSSYRNISQYLSTNGDWMSVYKVIDKDKILLQTAWTSYKSHYIHSYGQVVDPLTGQTSSSLQAETMLKAAWIGDRSTFDGVYSWTKDHFGYRGDHVFSRLWGAKNGKETVLDSESSSYADETIAYSLIVAYQKWHQSSYLTDAKNILSDIWKKEVTTRDGNYILVRGSDGLKNGTRVDLRSIQPAMLRTFATVDSNHPWNTVADDSYVLLDSLQGSNSASQLPEEINLDSGITQVQNGEKPLNISQLIIALDLDKKLLTNKKAQPEIATIASNYTITGTSAEPLVLTDTAKAKTAYSQNIVSKFNEQTGIFGKISDISLQNTDWFVAALYTNDLPPTQ